MNSWKAVSDFMIQVLQNPTLAIEKWKKGITQIRDFPLSGCEQYLILLKRWSQDIGEVLEGMKGCNPIKCEIWRRELGEMNVLTSHEHQKENNKKRERKQTKKKQEDKKKRKKGQSTTEKKEQRSEDSIEGRGKKKRSREELEEKKVEEGQMMKEEESIQSSQNEVNNIEDEKIENVKEEDGSPTKKKVRREEEKIDGVNKQNPTHMIFVKNLHKYASEGDIKRGLEKNGQVVVIGIDIIKTRNGVSRGTALVEFENGNQRDEIVNSSTPIQIKRTNIQVSL